MWSRISSLYRNVIYGIRNIIKWFPIIWKDRDWDEYYLMKILSFKLGEMSKLHLNDGSYDNSSQVASRLLEASRLSDRIAEDDYIDEAFGDNRYLIDKIKVELIDTNEEGVKEVAFTGLTDEERKELDRLRKLEDELLERDIERLFDIMKQDLRSWWN